MPAHQCVHKCPCGAELRCGDPDKCAAGPFWRCAACDLDAYDDFFSRKEQATTQHEQEHAHEGQ